MADCFPPEADDLHRRWLPREIFADIGIVDTEAAADAPPEAAAGVEELAAQLAGILGGGGGGAKVCPLAPPPIPTPAVAAPRHGAQVCGQSVMVACGGTNGVGVAAAVSWPFVPYPPVQWQGGSNLLNLGGVLDYYYSALPPVPPCPVPPPANLRGGGTGVFIPRTDAYRPPGTFTPAPAKGATATRAWPGTGTGTRPATGRKQQEWQQNETSTATAQKLQEEKAPVPGPGPGAALPLHACSPNPRPAELALPQDWSYR